MASATAALAEEPAPTAMAQYEPTVPIMEVEEVEPGMTGYGLTVFRGTQVERFDVEVRGVLSNAWAEGDMIVVELAHNELLDIGVVAGMSGSPVYIEHEGEEKLLGAVGFGWGFSVRPIGGVSPIRQMLREWDGITEEPLTDPDEASTGILQWDAAQAAFEWNRPGALRDITVPQVELAAMGIEGMTDPAGTVTFQPLSVPVALSTRHPRVFQAAQQAFAGSLMQPVMAGASMRQAAGVTGSPAAGDSGRYSTSLLPGSAMSVIYVDGDLHMVGTGTVTYVDGNKLVAFGHPMTGMGAVDAPIGPARIVSVIPALIRPFKLAIALAETGALRQDRQFAVGAHLEGRAGRVPMEFTVRNTTTDLKETFNYRAWDNRQMLGGLAYICLLESTLNKAPEQGPVTVDLRYEFTLEDGRVMDGNWTSSGDWATIDNAAVQLGRAISTLQNNPFEPVRITDIRGDLAVSELRQAMVLERIVRGNWKINPGETIRGAVEYRRFRDENERLEFSIPTPKDLEPGEYELHIVDGQTRRALEARFNPSLQRAESLDDLIRAMEPEYPTDSAYVLLVAPEDRLVVDRQTLDRLPSSVAEITRATSRDPELLYTSKGRLIEERRYGFDAAVGGDVKVTITVEEK